MILYHCQNDSYSPFVLDINFVLVPDARVGTRLTELNASVNATATLGGCKADLDL